MNGKIRVRGLILCVLGFGMAYAAVAFQLGLGSSLVAINGIPGAIGLVGLLELVSGCPFYKVAAKWDALHGLVRFGLGLVIIGGFIAGAFWAAQAFYFHG